MQNFTATLAHVVATESSTTTRVEGARASFFNKSFTGGNEKQNMRLGRDSSCIGCSEIRAWLQRRELPLQTVASMEFSRIHLRVQLM